MKSKIGGLKELMACVMLALCVQPTVALADLVRPLKPMYLDKWLASTKKCPDQSMDESVKNAFRDWAVRQMPVGLNGVEREIVFDWQLACCEAERRPWRMVFYKFYGGVNRDGKPWQRVDDGWKKDYMHWLSDDPRGKELGKGFEDFSARLSASEYVLKWAANAKRIDYPFRAYETALVNKAKDSKRDFGKDGLVGFSYNRNVTHFSWLSSENKPRKHSMVRLIFCGQVHPSDIDCAVGYCLKLKGDNDWFCELAELRFVACTPETMGSALKALSGWAIEDCAYVVGKEDAAGTLWRPLNQPCLSVAKMEAMDMSGFHGLKVKKVSFFNVEVKGFGTTFSAPWIEDLRFEECEVTDMSFVSGLPNVRNIEVKNSVVSDCSDLSRLKKLSAVRFVKSTGPISLGFLKGNASVATLIVQGSQVKDACVIGTCENLSYMDISGCSWEDNDWLAVVKNFQRDICVAYDEKCIPVNLVVPFKRVLEENELTWSKRVDRKR